jgi:hypothetical protein
MPSIDLSFSGSSAPMNSTWLPQGNSIWKSLLLTLQAARPTVSSIAACIRGQVERRIVRATLRITASRRPGFSSKRRIRSCEFETDFEERRPP